MATAELIALIIQVGLPMALQLAKDWKSKEPVTAETWAKLDALALQTPQTQMQAALTRAGIALDSPKAKELLALIGG